MRAKPSWLFFLLWVVAYFILDVAYLLFVHRRFAFADVPSAVKDAAIGAAITWLIALYRWYKADSTL